MCLSDSLACLLDYFKDMGRAASYATAPPGVGDYDLVARLPMALKNLELAFKTGLGPEPNRSYKACEGGGLNLSVEKRYNRLSKEPQEPTEVADTSSSKENKAPCNYKLSNSCSLPNVRLGNIFSTVDDKDSGLIPLKSAAMSGATKYCLEAEPQVMTYRASDNSTPPGKRLGQINTDVNSINHSCLLGELQKNNQKAQTFKDPRVICR